MGLQICLSGVRCMWMRGGTSKGGFFLADDLPPDVAERDAFLLRVMGSPDPRQIDGMGGADPLTSKVAVVAHLDARGRRCRLSVPAGVRRSADRHRLRRIAATCSPASAPSRSSAGWSPATGERDARRDLHGQYRPGRGRARCETPGGAPTYDGDARIDGVPGTAAPIPLVFRDTAGSSCGALLPTGNAVDVIDGVAVHPDRQRHALRGRSRPRTSARPAMRTATRWTPTPR